MKIGQKGSFRVWGDKAPGINATVQGHQDAGYLSIQKENGKFPTFSPADGTVIGEADIAGGWERVTFDGANILMARPDGGPALAYEWFNLDLS